MESAAKRKAASGAAPENESRPSKRQKVPGDAGTASETVESTRTMGLKFLDSLKAAKDKTGRPIAVHFLTLPDKDEIPEYYDVIKLPIAIDTIEGKLDRGEYTSLAQVESDCKRLVNNAKAFNDKKSIIYEDAERLRKTASNWMTKHNPAYRDGNYQAIATPVPGEELALPGRPIPRAVATPKAAATPTPLPATDRPRRAAAVAQPNTPAPSKLRNSASAVPEQGSNGPSFEGKSFQQAQDQIVREMVEYVEPDSGLQIFQPFINLPSRSLKDYYALIKQPMSLSGVQKKVRGVIGRNPPTGITEYKSWNAFEEDASMIWKNARIYNEDGSDLYNLSIELEELFRERLAAAKAKVEEPAQPKLKINLSTGAGASTPAPAPKQQLKLKLRQSPGSDPNTPAARSSATPGVIVDNEALLRQQRHVLESMNGARSSRPSSSGKAQTPSAAANPFAGPRGVSNIAASVATGQMATAGSPPTLNGIKNDIQSPALNAIRPASNASDGQSQRLSAPAQTPGMAPPHAASRATSGSPFPNGIIGQQQTAYPQYQQPSYPAPPATTRFEDFRKVPLKSPDEALIPKITLSTHPALSTLKPWSASISANKEKTSQSVTMSLPPAHSYIQIVPRIPVALSGRDYRLFVLINNKQILESNRVPVTSGINGAGLGLGYETGKKKGEPVFEAKLNAGVNRIEVDLIAEKDKKSKLDSKDARDHVDIEKCTIFLHLMRTY